MTHALFYALLAGASMAAYSIFSRIAYSPCAGRDRRHRRGVRRQPGADTHPEGDGLGAALYQSGLYLVAVVGLAAAYPDLFTLSAYASGLRVGSSFVISGTSTALALLVGFLVLREPFTLTKLLAAGLIAAGVFLLQREGL